MGSSQAQLKHSKNQSMGSKPSVHSERPTVPIQPRPISPPYIRSNKQPQTPPCQLYFPFFPLIISEKKDQTPHPHNSSKTRIPKIVSSTYARKGANHMQLSRLFAKYPC